MGYLVLDQIRKEIANNFGNRTDMGTGRIDTWFDMAQMRIGRLKDWEELHLIFNAYPSNTGSLDNDRFLFLGDAINFRKIYSVRRTQNNPGGIPGELKKIEMNQWDRVVGEARYYSRGKPDFYTQWEPGRLELFRIPDVTYEFELRASKWPDSAAMLIANQGGVNFAKSNFKNMDDALIFLASTIGFLSYGRKDKATEYFNMYRQIMKESFDLDEEDLDTVQAAFLKEGPRGWNTSNGYDDPFIQRTV